MRLQGKDASAFKFTLKDCPAVTVGELSCELKVTFRPPKSGSYEAEIFVPVAGDAGTGHGLVPLRGVATEPTTITDPPTTSRTAKNPTTVPTT